MPAIYAHPVATTDADVSDRELLGRVVACGDETAFAVLVRRHRGHVHACCVRILRDADRAADATQDTFIRLNQAAAGIACAMGGSLGSWLHQTATRICIDRIRSDERRRGREAVAADRLVRDHTGRATDPGAAAATRELTDQLDRCLLDLDRDSRELLHRYFFREESLRAIAATDGSSAATVQRRIRRALKQLRERLGARGVRHACVIGGGAGLAAAVSEAAAAPPVPAAVSAELNRIALVSRVALTHPPLGTAGAIAQTGGFAARAALWIVPLGLLLFAIIFLAVRSGLRLFEGPAILG